MDKLETGYEGYAELPFVFLTVFLILFAFIYMLVAADISLGARNLMEEETGLAAMQLTWNTYSFHLFPDSCGSAQARFGPAPVGKGEGAFRMRLMTVKGDLECTLWPWRADGGS